MTRLAERMDAAGPEGTVGRSSPRMQRSSGTGLVSARRGAGGESRLFDLYQEGSARIRLPNSHSAGRLEAVLLNTSGGMTGGDRLAWRCEAGDGTHLTLATQTAERLYRAMDGRAETKVHLTVGRGARLDWLAQETILFDGARFSRSITCDLAEDASLLLCEPLVFGRSGMGEIVQTGALADRWTIRRGGRPVHIEALRIEGAIEDMLQGAAVAGGRRAHATVLLLSPEAEACLEPARAILGESGGASFFDGKLLVRLMATGALALRRRLLPLLLLLRGGYALPRCWSI